MAMNFLRVFTATLGLALLVSFTHSKALPTLPNPNATKVFGILEEALLDDNETLYQLQRLFYPPNNPATVTASIYIDIIISDTSCYVSGCGFYNETCSCFQDLCEFQWTSQAVNKHSELSQFLFSGSACPTYAVIDFSANTLLSLFTPVTCDNIDSPNSAKISLHIEKIYCSDVSYDPLATLVSWVSLHY